MTVSKHENEVGQVGQGRPVGPPSPPFLSLSTGLRLTAKTQKRIYLL